MKTRCNTDINSSGRSRYWYHPYAVLISIRLNSNIVRVTGVQQWYFTVKNNQNVVCHPRMPRVNVSGCLKAITMEVHFVYAVKSQNLQVKFTYQGHRVKVKVTGYYHTSMLSTRVAYPDKKQDLGYVTDPEWQTLMRIYIGWQTKGDADAVLTLSVIYRNSKGKKSAEI